MATQPPQQIPALGFPTIHTAVLGGCEQRLAIRGEGGEVDLEESTEVVPHGARNTRLFDLDPRPRANPELASRSLGLELWLQASLNNQSTGPRNHSAVRAKGLELSGAL